MVRPRIRNRAHGLSFGANAGVYDAYRPDYPSEVVALCASVTGGQHRVLDVGAGTGKLSSALANAGLTVTAVDPDSQALELNTCPTVLAHAEDLPFADGSFDCITVAQAWHWLDAQRATQEFRRVLAPGGVVVIIINQLDVREDWVLRIARITHAGDVYRPGWVPKLNGFAPAHAYQFPFVQTLDFAGIVNLASTRSYWLRSNHAQRARIVRHLDDYLHRENPMPDTLDLPYVCLAYVVPLTE